MLEVNKRVIPAHFLVLASHNTFPSRAPVADFEIASLAGPGVELSWVPSPLRGLAVLTILSCWQTQKRKKIISSGPLAFLSWFFGLFPRSHTPYDSYWSLEGLLSETALWSLFPFHSQDFFFVVVVEYVSNNECWCDLLYDLSRQGRDNNMKYPSLCRCHIITVI